MFNKEVSMDFLENIKVTANGYNMWARYGEAMKKTLVAMVLLVVMAGCGGGSGNDKNGVDLSDSLAGSIMADLSNASSKYEDFKSSLSEDDARLALVEWLKIQDGVIDAGLSEDGFTIWFNDANGINMNILTYSNSYTDLSLLKTVASIRYTSSGVAAATSRGGEGASIKYTSLGKHLLKGTGSSMPGAQWLYMYVPFLWEQTQACVREGLFDGVDINLCSSIDDFPFVDLSGIRDLSKYYTDPGTGLSFYAVPYINEDASIDSMASIFTMGMTSEAHIFIHTHGGVTTRNGEKFGYFLTADELSYDNYADRKEDLISGRLSVTTHAGKHYYSITPTFVKKHFEEMSAALGIKPNFHVYVAACKSYDPAMIGAFMDSGADSYSGYTGLASHEFIYNSVMSMFSSLSEGKTVKEAIASLSPRFDSHNFLTQMMTTTSSDKERYFYRMFLTFGMDDRETPPVQKLTVTEDTDGGFIITGILTMPPEDGEKSGSPVGTISLKLPAALAGEYKIDIEQNAVISLLDNATGKHWIASKECIDDNPLCLCSGTITVEYADDDTGGVVEGRFDAMLVDKDNVTVTNSISGTFSAVR